MSDPRQELEELRRLEDLERKLASQDLGEVRKQKERSQANVYAGQDVGQMGAFMRGVGGAKQAFDSAAMGLKGLFTDLTPEDKALLEQGKAFVKQGDTAATVGNIAGEIGMLAAPSTRAIQGVQAASMAAKAVPYLGKALAATRTGTGAAAAGSGLASAALAPEDRTGAFYGGAAGGAVGDVAGRFLTKALGGVVSDKVSPAARELMDQGANVPMWKATDDATRTGRVLRNVAERAKALPVAGDIIKGQERAGVESWNKVLLREATPPQPVLDDAGSVLRWERPPVKDVGSKGLQELSERFDQAYGALYGSRGMPVDDQFNKQVVELLRNTKAYLPGASDDVAGAVRKATDTLAGLTSPTTTRSGGENVGKGLVSSRIKTPITTSVEPGREVTTHGNVKKALDGVNDSITSAWKAGDAEKAEALTALRSTIESLRSRGLPPEVASEAAEINKAYAKFKTVSRASSMLGAQKEGGVVTPAQQLNAIRARDKTLDKSAFSRGEAPGQQQALTAQQVYGNTLPDVGPGTAEKMMLVGGFGLPMVGMDAGASLLLGTQAGQNMLMGKYPVQGAVRKYGQEYLIPALRNYGAALGN